MKECPLCGSKDVYVLTSIDHHSLIDDSTFQYKEKCLHCNCCREEINLPESDINFEKAYKKAQHKFVIKMLKEIKSSGINFVDIERKYHLPFRTLSRWKQGDFSNLSVAFLYLLKRRIFINEN